MTQRRCSPFANRATVHPDLSNNFLEVGYNFLDLERSVARRSCQVSAEKCSRIDDLLPQTNLSTAFASISESAINAFLVGHSEKGGVFSRRN
jgi:hypothetical protein